MITKYIQRQNTPLCSLLKLISPGTHSEQLHTASQLFQGLFSLERAINQQTNTPFHPFHPGKEQYIELLKDQHLITKHKLEEILKKEINTENINSVRRFFKKSPNTDNGLGL